MANETLLPDDILRTGKSTGAVAQDVIDAEYNLRGDNPTSISLEMIHFATEGVLGKLAESGVVDAYAMSQRLAELSGDDPLADLFTVAMSYEEESAAAKDPNYQRVQKRRAALAGAAGATAATTAVYAMQGAEFARPTFVIARSMAKDARHDVGIGALAHGALSSMLDEIEGKAD